MRGPAIAMVVLTLLTADPARAFEKPDLSALKPFWDTSDKPEPEANTKPSLTEALYGNPTQRMENTLGRTLDQNISEIRDHLALTNDQAQAMRKKHVQWFTDIVLTGDAESVHTLLASRTLKPATEEEQTAWVSQTMKEVRQRFGDNGRSPSRESAEVDRRATGAGGGDRRGRNREPPRFCAGGS